MKIARIESTKTQINKSNRLANYQSNSCVINKNSQLTKYNPIYYKPFISFKGNNFESYFPTKTLGYNEQAFDDLILKAIQNPDKKRRIINCITSETENNHKTMEFVNMWQRAVPSIVSQNLFSNLSGQGGEELFYRFGTQGIASNATSPIKKFFESDYQTDIIKKDAKSVTAGVISSKLFVMGMADPEPASKAAFIAAAVVTGGIGYVIRGNDSKKILDKQFVDASKELIKCGVVDPYNIINSTMDPKHPLVLSNDKLKEYRNWKDRRILDLRYYKTGSYKNLHNDFNSYEGQNVLSKSLLALRRMGFSDKLLSNYLSVMGLIYHSCGETQEAQYLMERSLDIQKNIYGKDSAKLIDTLKDLAAVHEENEEPINARNTLKEILRITETSSPNDIDAINKAKKNLLLSDFKNILTLSKKRMILTKDYNLSITESRRSKIKDELIPKIETNIGDACHNLNEMILEQHWILNLKRPELIQILELINKYRDVPSLRHYTMKLLHVFLSPKSKSGINAILNPIKYNEVSPELYYTMMTTNGKINGFEEGKNEIIKSEGSDSLYLAHYIEQTDVWPYLEQANDIFKCNSHSLESNEHFDRIRCILKSTGTGVYWGQEVKDEITEALPTEQKKIMKKEIAEHLISLGETAVCSDFSTGREAISLDECIEKFLGKALNYNPNRVESVLNVIWPNFCKEEYLKENVHWKDLNFVTVTGKNDYERNRRKYDIAYRDDETIIPKLIEYIKEESDPFALNKRFLLLKQRELINPLFGKNTAKEKVSAEIRSIESNLKFMKIK